MTESTPSPSDSAADVTSLRRTIAAEDTALGLALIAEGMSLLRLGGLRDLTPEATARLHGIISMWEAE